MKSSLVRRKMPKLYKVNHSENDVDTISCQYEASKRIFCNYCKRYGGIQAADLKKIRCLERERED